MKKRIASLLMAMLMLAGSSAVAETTKHERVYAVVGADGTLLTVIDNVRLEDTGDTEIIEDATMLDDVENVGGQEHFTREGEALIWQADGQSIVYQGTADKPPYATPVVRMTLNGEEATAEDVKNGEGELTIEVSYAMSANEPFLALSMLSVGEDALTDIAIDHGTVFSDGSRTMIIGWAVPGLDQRMELPDNFTVTARADHADLSWLMTAATAQPVEILCRELAGHAADAHDFVDSLTDGLTALRDGQEITGDDEIAEAMRQLRTLFDGAAALSDGTQALADGAASADEGAAALESGLSTLTANNEALNQGAAAIFAAILDTANTQLASSGIDAAGITLPTLSADNYAEALDAALAQLDPDALTAAATAQAREQIKAAVMRQEDAVRTAVAQAAEAKALEGVLSAAGLTLSADEYAAAVHAGQIKKEQAAQIEAAVEQAMAADEVSAQIEEAVAQQIEVLTDEQLASEAVQAQIAEGVSPARAPYEALSALKAQLDSVNTFVTGLTDYTAGVTQAADGAVQLHGGTNQLSSGAAELNTGAAELASGLETAKAEVIERALSLLDGDIAEALDVFDATSAQADGSLSYDLVADGMAHDLLFIIRTDLNQ